MRRLLYLIFILFTIPTFVLAQTWTQRASIFNYGRYSSIGCAANGKGYVGMGQNELGVYMRDFWEYDPLPNIWTRKTDFPSDGRYGASAYVIKGKIYVCFGYDNSKISRNDLWEYNPVNDSWVKKADFPGQARYSAAGFVIRDSVLYIGTGTYGNSDDYLYDFWMYNPTSDTWTRKSDFPGYKRQDAASFSIDDIGFLGSGLSGYLTPTKDFWKYDPKADTWSAIQSLPVENATLVSFTIDGKGYVGGGIASVPFESTNNFFEYDPNTNKWTVFEPQDKAFPRRAGIGFSIGNIGFFGTGYNDINLYFSDFWAFNIYFNNEDDEDDEEDDDDNDDNENECKCYTSYELKLFPNPTTDKVTLEIDEEFELDKMTIFIYNSLGQIVIQQTTESNKKVINVSNLESGLYLTRVYLDNLIIVKKFIKL